MDPNDALRMLCTKLFCEGQSVRALLFNTAITELPATRGDILDNILGRIKERSVEEVVKPKSGRKRGLPS